jgi:hypothetical protein
MKKALFFLIALGCLGVSPLRADPAGKLGLGLVVGNPFGPTIKYWMDSRTAIDVGVGFDEDPIFYADYLWHNWGLTRQPSSGQLGFYAGVGPRFESIDHHDDEFGIRVPFGMSYLFQRSPIELFGEIVPVFVLSPDTDTEVDAGVGVRFLLGG